MIDHGPQREDDHSPPDDAHEQTHAQRTSQCGLPSSPQHSKEHPEYKARLGRWARQLLKDKVEQLIAAARKECSGQSQAAAVEEALGYFVNNVARMQYGTFRRQGFFIGSGVIEAGCKTIIGSRCKQSGMFWSVRAQTLSCASAAASSTVALGTVGRGAGRLDFHFHVAHPMGFESAPRQSAELVQRW